ncbi:MAG: hypothetical protein U0Y10_23685 [Spirosomataceae bacterium]
MKQITLQIPDQEYAFVMKLVKQLIVLVVVYFLSKAYLTKNTLL